MHWLSVLTKRERGDLDLMGETLKRLLTALVFLPFFLGALFSNKFYVLFTGDTTDLYWDNFLFFLVIILFAGFIGALEVLDIARQKNIPIYKKTTLITVILVILSQYLQTVPRFGDDAIPFLHSLATDYNFDILYLFLLSSIIIFTFETFKKDFRLSMEAVGIHLLTVFYAGFMLGNLVRLIAIPGLPKEVDGEILYYGSGQYFILFLFAIAWLSDTGAYFSGKLFGKHKMGLRVSPNKSVEGYIGGIISAVITTIIFVWIAFPDEYMVSLDGELAYKIFGYTWMIPVVIALTILAQLGDLAESMIKRSGNVKDSQQILPGHGGVLDAADSIIYINPVFYFIFTLTVDTGTGPLLQRVNPFM